MPRQTVTVIVATLLGIAAGGLVFWKVLWHRKNKTCAASKQRQVAREQEFEDSPEEKCLSFVFSPSITWVDKILGGEIVIISKAEEWNEVEPLLKYDFEHCPVLGIDCEWVSLSLFP